MFRILLIEPLPNHRRKKTQTDTKVLWIFGMGGGSVTYWGIKVPRLGS